MNPQSSIDDDDVDEFLYGSSTPDATKNTRGSSSNQQTKEESSSGAPTPSTSAKDAAQEDDEDLYQLYRGSSANEAQEINTKQEMEVDQEVVNEEAPKQEANTDQMQEEDSEDDLEIILEPEDQDQTSSQRAAGQPEASPAPGGEKPSGSGLVNIKPGQAAKASTSAAGTLGTAQGRAATSSTAAGGSSAAGGKSTTGGINLEAIGEYNGQPITEIDLDSFEDKPWRKPGADITDYFNYGFNEVTWRAYCAQQKMMRESKKMMGDMDMGDFMSMGMMMPPAAMMDGAMPLGMPGMPNPMMAMPPMGMGPPVGMSSPAPGPSTPANMRGGAGRGTPNFGMRGGRPMGRPSNRPDGQNEQQGDGPMNNQFFWPQMQPPFFP